MAAQSGAQETITQLRQASENCHRAWQIALDRHWLEPMSAAIDGWLYYWEITGGYREGEVLIAATMAVLEAGIGLEPIIRQPSSAPQLQGLLAKLWRA